MARKPAEPTPPARPSRSSSASSSRGADSRRASSLSGLRTEIDRVDRDLVTLLNRRAEIATQIGEVKETQGLEVWSPAREDEVVGKALQASAGPLQAETLRRIFRELMSGSRAIQRTLRVACLGPRYSYSHLAAVAKFGNAVEHVPLGSISAVFEEVNRRQVQFGIVPLENSTDGRIADTLDMFAKVPNVRVRAEVRLRIHHCLMARCPWGQVQRIYSKAQALSQCRHWLARNLPQIRLIDVVSTAAAAEFASREEFAGAIASRPAADAYGLSVLAENIEDKSHNVTRFAVIAEQGEARTGRDKTTLMLRLSHSVGALHKVLESFVKQGVNLTWIESFPSADAPASKLDDPAYLFFMDVEGHAQDEPVAKALESARKRCERLDVLGSYPRGEVIDG
jgi:chorismate mutase/prephenate dehydratase